LPGGNVDRNGVKGFSQGGTDRLRQDLHRKGEADKFRRFRLGGNDKTLLGEKGLKNAPGFGKLHQGREYTPFRQKRPPVRNGAE
jgi:hypothetical protein